MTTTGPEMPLLEHLEELRRRLLRCFIAIGIGFLACYSFAEQMFKILMEPLVKVLPANSTLIYTSVAEGFITYVKVALVGGFFVASPYLFFQVWRFIAPGLYREERILVIPVAFFSAFFFVAGALFGYFVVFPYGFEFFMSFGDQNIVPMPAMSDYFSFTITLLFAFGVVFELPVFIFFLARLGLVTAKSLRKFQRYAILLAFIVSAIITPPDVISQCMMAAPLMVLYEIGIWVAYFFGKKKKEPIIDDDDEDDSDPTPDPSSPATDDKNTNAEETASSEVEPEASETDEAKEVPTPEDEQPQGDDTTPNTTEEASQTPSSEDDSEKSSEHETPDVPSDEIAPPKKDAKE